MDQSLVKASRYLSRILRHRPHDIGLTLDAGGWAEIGTLILKSNGRLDDALLRQVVADNGKQRFAISPNGLRIRANQGHSVPVDLGLAAITPPETLYHGTVARFIDAIQREGLMPRGRQFVHLSRDEETAQIVGQRRGEPVILRIAALALHQQGTAFYLSENNVWLTDHVPPDAITFPPAP